MDYFSDELWSLGFLLAGALLMLYVGSGVGGPVVPETKPVIHVCDPWSYELGDKWQRPVFRTMHVRETVKIDAVQLVCQPKDLSQGSGSVNECFWRGPDELR
jgi:hypothetical protein